MSVHVFAHVHTQISVISYIKVVWVRETIKIEKGNKEQVIEKNNRKKVDEYKSQRTPIGSFVETKLYIQISERVVAYTLSAWVKEELWIYTSPSNWWEQITRPKHEAEPVGEESRIQGGQGHHENMAYRNN